jgi:signal transduction histidine kinase
VELLQDGDEGPLTTGQAEFLDAISRNSSRLKALADDLLTVSGLESPGNKHPHRVLDLRDVLQAAQCALTPTISASHLTVTFEMPADPVVVLGNSTDLEAMVMNLMSNALKFTKEGGWVHCTLRELTDTAHLEVSDNGLGIPRAEQCDLFTRFFRSSTAQEHAIQGTGLGLTIVDTIVQSHGGDISVESEHLEGSTFTVELPLVAEPTRRRHAPASPMTRQGPAGRQSATG